MKEACIEFSKLNTIEGLTKYENHGNIKLFEKDKRFWRKAVLLDKEEKVEELLS